MNNTVAGLSVIPIVISLIFYFKMKKEKRMLDDNDPIEGTVSKYQRIGKRLYPIIEFKDNGEEKYIRQGGITNFRMIKEGTKVRIISIGDGKYLTDYSVKLSKYYAITMLLAGLLVFFISFCID